MRRETSRRVAERCGEGLYWEVLVRLEQQFHRTTGKLVGVTEIGRERRRLFRLAGEGERPTVQLVDVDTYDVLMLVEAPPQVAPVAPAPPVVCSAGGRTRPRQQRPRAPSSGQSGPPLDLREADLNPKEVRVLRALSEGGQQTLKELEGVFSGEPSSRANSWARNALRRLVRGGLVRRVGKGTYCAVRAAE